MNIESQVCGLELAKRLNELGVKQESVFYWIEWKPLTEPRGRWHWTADHPIAAPNGYVRGKLSAFTVAELGEMLQRGMEGSWMTASGKWACKYKPLAENSDATVIEQECETEADARAKMLIYLLEHNLLH